MPDTYVHGEVEVKKTGREAERPLPGNKKQVLVEITPVHDDDGSWKKWVNPSTLFLVQPPKGTA